MRVLALVALLGLLVALGVFALLDRFAEQPPNIAITATTERALQDRYGLNPYTCLNYANGADYCRRGKSLPPICLYRDRQYLGNAGVEWPRACRRAEDAYFARPSRD